jgi:hypothetical protein
MSIIIECDRSDFVAQFAAYGRQDNYTPAAMDAMFAYFDDLSDDTGEFYTLDVIAICCDVNEMTLDELRREYDCCAGCETVQECADALNGETTVIGTTSETVVFFAF